MKILSGFLEKRPRSSSTVINLLLSLYIVVFLNAPFWSRFSLLLGTATATFKVETAAYKQKLDLFHS